LSVPHPKLLRSFGLPQGGGKDSASFDCSALNCEKKESSALLPPPLGEAGELASRWGSVIRVLTYPSNTQNPRANTVNFRREIVSDAEF
jgi:hypothetical protein